MTPAMFVAALVNQTMKVAYQIARTRRARAPTGPITMTYDLVRPPFLLGQISVIHTASTSAATRRRTGASRAPATSYLEATSCSCGSGVSCVVSCSDGRAGIRFSARAAARLDEFTFSDVDAALDRRRHGIRSCRMFDFLVRRRNEGGVQMGGRGTSCGIQRIGRPCSTPGCAPCWNATASTRHFWWDIIN